MSHLACMQTQNQESGLVATFGLSGVFLGNTSYFKLCTASLLQGECLNAGEMLPRTTLPYFLKHA